MNISVERQAGLKYSEYNYISRIEISMLINCPRCGFQQPKDQYCAQCGVDIEAFKPAKPSAFQSLVKSPLVQLSIAFIAIAGVGSFIYQQNQQRLESRVEYLRSSPQRPLPAPVSETTTASVQATSTETAPELATADTIQRTQSSEPEENAEVSEMASFATPAAASAAVTPTPSPTSPANAPAKSGTPRLVVTYAEVGRGALNGIMTTSRGTGQFMNFNDYSAGIIPGIQRILNSPDVTVLRKEDRSLDTNRSFSWFLGIKDPQDPNHEIGLTTFFELNEIEQGILRGNLEILRSWREPGFGREPQRKSFPAMFEISNDNGFFMAGILPQQSHLTNEAELTNIDLYKILNSPRFKSDQSELVIFVQYGKAP